MEQRKENKISEIVRLRQKLKKWRKIASATKQSSSSSKSIKSLKRTLSFSDSSTSGMATAMATASVPKGFLMVCVGKEMKRFTIPTDYLSYRAFGVLLREAKDEFGFQQEGVLRIPCEVAVFEKILKVVEEKREVVFIQDLRFNADNEMVGCCSSQADISQSHRPPKPLCG